MSLTDPCIPLDCSGAGRRGGGRCILDQSSQVFIHKVLRDMEDTILKRIFVQSFLRCNILFSPHYTIIKGFAKLNKVLDYKITKVLLHSFTHGEPCAICRYGLETVMKYGGAEPGDRTMVSVKLINVIFFVFKVPLS